MLSAHVRTHLAIEIARSDPWRLQVNPFEQDRYARMLEMLGPVERFASALEIGCAAGVFTERLAERCVSLRGVDVLPEAIDRCRARLAHAPHVRYTLADISEEIGWNETYDLIVVSEVFYYFPDVDAVRGAIAQLSQLVRPGGTVLFGSAINAVVRRWGRTLGAETAMQEWSRFFREIERYVCRGQSPDECALLVTYTRDA
jgi:2-polyprenyl-3-methyl-5-hydroxy-6-metoxy-1,4-benzoquinol methylase